MPTTTVQAADSRRDLLIHDIRTPLATISGYAELADVQAQSGTHAGILHRQPTDLVQLARRVAADSQDASLWRCHVVVMQGVPELVGLWDPARLERAIANLIDNALKYSREHRPVVV